MKDLKTILFKRAMLAHGRQLNARLNPDCSNRTRDLLHQDYTSYMLLIGEAGLTEEFEAWEAAQ